MSVKWTEKQLEAIESRGENILVSAAAGSGKTAVLVERIIRIITDSENPVSIDRLLVLTFTEAAATEMKRKIAEAINKKLEDDPDNKWLKEQSVKVSSAAISTIHAFCSRIISNNAHLTDLPADFSLIDDTENKVLEEQAVDHVMENYYSRIDKKKGFRELALGWSAIKGDDNIRSIIIKLHDMSRSLAYPRKWFSYVYKNGYKGIKDGNGIEASLWMELIKELVMGHYYNICDAMDKILAIIDRDVPTDCSAYTYYYEMCSGFKKEIEEIDFSSDESFEKLCAVITNFKIKIAKGVTGADDVLPRLVYLRDKIIKKNISDISYILSIFDEENIDKISKCEPVVKILCNIVRLTEKVHQKYKRERSVIDFNDLEYGLFKLVIDEKGRDTQLCEKLREYYHEILIDEFQDTNNLQFEIFSHLSKNNLFMVGDVKQSIYRFRNADPSIFLRLYKSYKNGDGGKLICLSQNFRSRSQVVDGVNDIFDVVMSERCGEIDYDGEERLVCGATYPENSGCETEVIVADLSDTSKNDELIDELMTENLEAYVVAKRIQKLVCDDDYMVYDKDAEAMRRIKYGDVVVLCKTMEDKTAIEAELIQLGISSVMDGGQHYLTTVEVSTIVAFLQIIDNPIQDVPLIAVMRSAMFRFDVEELANIRICADGRFFDAVCAAAQTNKKAEKFIEYLNELRECSKYMGVDELVRKICADRQYFALVGAMPGGELRKANVKLFLERCADFEMGALKGIFNFVKYIEMLKKKNEDFSPAKDDASEDDSVKIMTIHKSKGLEFPVVVVFRAGKRFNYQDAKGKIICCDKAGFGLDYVDIRQRVKFSLPTREIVKRLIEQASIAEEMRLLYVALTRAKEKLIISASIGSIMNYWKDAEYDENEKLLPCFALKASCMRDWIFSALLRHPSGGLLRNVSNRLDIIPSLKTSGEFNVYEADFSAYQGEYVEENEVKVTEYDDADMQERLEYSYPYSHLAKLPIKLSVSDVKRRQMAEDSYTGNLVRSEGMISNEDDITAMERGTITHFVIQHIDERKTDSLCDVEEQLEHMVKKGIINTKQKDAVNVDSIYGFFASDLGVRLKNADKIEREFDFYMLVDYDEIDKNINKNCAEQVILQGIADCFFYENGEIVLVDFKTDRVDENTVRKRAEAYRTQLDYYSKGLSKVLGSKIKEKYLYFLSCGEFVKM